MANKAPSNQKGADIEKGARSLRAGWPRGRELQVGTDCLKGASNQEGAEWLRGAGDQERTKWPRGRWAIGNAVRVSIAMRRRMANRTSADQ